MPTRLPITRRALNPLGVLFVRRQRGTSDAELAIAVSDGDEAAFLDVVERFSPAMLRVAQLHVVDEGLARELVSATWVTVIETLRRDRPGSPIKLWIFGLLVRAASHRAQEDGRLVPLSAVLASEIVVPGQPSVDPGRFFEFSHPEIPFHWALPPTSWEESRLSGPQTLTLISSTIETLPVGQRAVLGLRDIDGWTADEVQEVLKISADDQRLLLHRARAAIRRALEVSLGEAAQ